MKSQPRDRMHDTQTMTEIVVVIPVLDRPQNAQAVIASLELADPDRLCRPLFVCTPGDRRQIHAAKATGADVLIHDRPAGPGDFASKINHAYRATTEPFLFQAADDVAFQPGWAEAALYAIDKDGFGVCGTFDGANPVVKRGLHSTHSLIRRAYVEECGASWDGPGSVFSEAYSHQWTDSELVELGKARGCFTFCRDAVVLHHHPMYDRSVVRDATYERGLADGAADRALFHRRQREWLHAFEAA